LLASALAACAKQPPRPAATLPTAPADRLAAVRAGEERIRSLRARFTSVTHLPGGERSVDGVLLVAKPDRFRLRLMLPFGITVFDFLSVGEQTWVVLPLGDQRQRNADDAFAAFSRDDLGAAFLRGPYAFPGTCTASAGRDDAVLVDCVADAASHRTIRIDRAAITEETSYTNDTPRLRIRYRDYRDVSGVSVPFHITLEYPLRQQSVDIAIDAYEVNPVLSATAFVPPPDTPPRRS
jgi:outer membrane biogenesis lipoprotein LolB